MISPTKIDAFFYHHPCPDGSMCLAIAKFSGVEDGRGRTFPYVHGQRNAHSLALMESWPRGLNVVFCDCSPSLQEAEVLHKGGHKAWILDHHKTALPNRSYFEGLGFHFIFNIEKCGAELLWEEWYGVDNVPMTVKYTGDRDLWKWEMPHSREFSAGISLCSREDVLAEEIAGSSLKSQKVVNRVIETGSVILKYQEEQLRRATERAYFVKENPLLLTSGQVACFVNSTTLVSELGNYLCETFKDLVTFAVVYFETPEGWKFSLRSIGDFDVSQVAKLHRGGGHKNAAGFNMSFTDGCMLLQSSVRDARNSVER